MKLFEVNDFEEIAYLSDGDLGILLNAIENEVWQQALFICPPIVKERIFAQFSYMGWKIFEMDRRSLLAPDAVSIKKAQGLILETLNMLIEDRELTDYQLRKVT